MRKANNRLHRCSRLRVQFNFGAGAQSVGAQGPAVRTSSKPRLLFRRTLCPYRPTLKYTRRRLSRYVLHIHFEFQPLEVTLEPLRDRAAIVGERKLGGLAAAFDLDEE